MSLRPRRALVGLVAVFALLALPAVASAAITPTLAVTQTGTAAGTSPATVGLHATFTGGTPNNVSFSLPAGLLANANQAGGACLISSAPTAACQVGSGTVTAGVTPNVQVSLFLVAAPKTGDAAGLALVQGSTTLSTADVTVRSTDGGLDIAFSNLAPDALSDLNVSLTTLRLPSSCPSPAANITLTADSATTTAPLNVTGCSTLPYAPAFTATVTKDAKDSGGQLVLGVTQAATESANKSITLSLGKSITPNVGADVPCLTGSGPGCTIGTATATSPVVPDIALASGTITLSGSATSPAITVSFPAPFSLTISGTVNLATNSVTFANVPDIPLTSLTLTVTGPNGQKAFTTNCAASNLTGSFTAQGGQTKTDSAPIKFVNCAAKPTASGSTSGLASGHPKLSFKVTHGKGAANIQSLTVGLPSGLKFSRSAIVTRKTCTTKQGKKKCTTTTLTKGLGIKGGSAKTVALKGGKLVITLKKAAANVTISLSGPILTESKSLQTSVKKHKTKSLTVGLKVTDAKKISTSVPLKVKAH